MKKIFFALISCALLFSSCTFSRISDVPSSQLQSVFFHGTYIDKGSIYRTGSPYTTLFDVNHSFQHSSVSPLSTGILAFDSVKNMTSWYGVLYYITNKGTIISRTYMDDTSMVIHNDYALSQSEVYDADGFSYSLYKVKNDSLGSFASNPLEKIWTGNLDCFRSSVLFMGDEYDTVYLAGASYDNETNTLYRYTKEQSDFSEIFSTPHRTKLINTQSTETSSDFMYLISLQDGSLIIYPSQNVRAASFYEVFLLPEGETIPLKLSVSGVPSHALCFAGRGFETNGKIGITMALSEDEGGPVGMAVFTLSGTDLVCENIIENTYAASYVYGKDPNTGAYWYYGDSSTCSKDGNALCCFDGVSVTEQSLP